VLDKTQLGEPSDHFRHRRRFDTETPREILGADPMPFTSEEEDLFEVILLGLGEGGPHVDLELRPRSGIHIFRLT
jgi:hypothetical protein